MHDSKMKVVLPNNVILTCSIADYSSIVRAGRADAYWCCHLVDNSETVVQPTMATWSKQYTLTIG